METTSTEFTTSDGLALEAEIVRPSTSRGAAVVCHPHPLFGGTMYDNVVGHLYRRFAEAGLTTLRFNFRGVGASEGEHGGGRTERLDAIAAVEHVIDDLDDPTLRIVLAGYSFGSLVALSLTHERLSGWLAVAPPLTILDEAEPPAASDDRPTLIVAGAIDQFCRAEQARELTNGWRSTTVTAVEGADHFLATAGPALQLAVDRLLAQVG